MNTYLRVMLAVIMMAASQQVLAQKLGYEQGDKTVQIGFGLGGSFYQGSVKVPALQIRYEYGIKEKFSIGGILGYASSSYYYQNFNPTTGAVSEASLDYSYLIIGARGNYHFWTTEKFDPYAGLTIGYNSLNFTDTGGNLGTVPASSFTLYGAQVGANYYFKSNLGAWAELGYGLGFLNLGAVFKF